MTTVNEYNWFGGVNLCILYDRTGKKMCFSSPISFLLAH